MFSRFWLGAVRRGVWKAGINRWLGLAGIKRESLSKVAGPRPHKGSLYQEYKSLSKVSGPSPHNKVLYIKSTRVSPRWPIQVLTKRFSISNTKTKIQKKRSMGHAKGSLYPIQKLKYKNKKRRERPREPLVPWITRHSQYFY